MGKFKPFHKKKRSPTVKINKCRLCQSDQLRSLLDLGEQAFTGIFPKLENEKVPIGQLELVKCDKCDLVQLGHSFDLNQMYGLNYGYRSGLNGSMVRHLNAKVADLTSKLDLKEGDLVIDIGSNDGTTLRAYPDRGLTFVGIDPTAEKFRKYYPSDVKIIPNFFSAALVKNCFPNRKAKVVTSFSMFYDLEDPVTFMKEVSGILADDGLWTFEQSYLKSMLETTSYDTICHEHLEYYGLKQILLMADLAGLKIIDVDLNEVNGGSFSIYAAKIESKFQINQKKLDEMIAEEERYGLYSIKTFEKFAAKAQEHRKIIRQFFDQARAQGKKVIGYGASTKGNVLLQYCGITADDLMCIAEVNEDKFGSFTPGTLIPIVSEASARRMNPDYYFVLPWHFREGIVKREAEFMREGGNLIFPLPKFEVVQT
jgi:hypothetical protein